MTDVLGRVFVEFLVAREQAVQRPTYGRDLLVVAKLQAALDAVTEGRWGPHEDR